MTDRDAAALVDAVRALTPHQSAGLVAMVAAWVGHHGELTRHRLWRFIDETRATP